MLRKVFKKFNLLVIIINIILTSCCFAFDEVKVSTTRISEKIVDTSRKLRVAKEDKARHKRMEMDVLVNIDNRIIADLEEKKVTLEEELFLLNPDFINYLKNPYKN